MLDGVIRFSLKHRPLIVFLSLAVLLYGGLMTTSLPLDVLPDLDRPRVVILTEAHGLAPEEIELRITQPIETAMLGSLGVQAVRSLSSPGVSIINVEFDWDTPIRAARQTVQERLTTVKNVMPAGIEPLLTPVSSLMGQILHVGFHQQRGPQGGELAPVGETGLLAERLEGNRLQLWKPEERRNLSSWRREESQGEPGADAPGSSGELRTRIKVGEKWHDVVFLSPVQRRMELHAKAIWLIRPRLLQIPGVAEVFLMGGDRKQYQVVVDPDALEEYGVSLEQVEQAIKESNLNAAGGFSVRGETERPVRVLGLLGPLPADVLAQVLRITVKADKERTVQLAQVATVREGPQPKRGDASVDGHEGMVLTVAKQPHIDTRALTLQIEEALREIESSLTSDLIVNPQIFQLKRFIDFGIYYVGEALVIGAVLVLIVLTLFLLNARTTFISLTAIPLSLAITTLVFRLIGKLTGTELSINVMTLGGIAIAMGELVDDAIVDVENIYRRLRENHAAAKPKSDLLVVFEASREVRTAVVFGTIVVILVFLPLFALSGVEGRLFVPLGIAYIVSILASLLVSLTVTPVMAYHLLPQAKVTHGTSDGWLLRGLKSLAGPVIRLSMKQAPALLALTWLGVALAAWQLLRLDRDFLPKFDEGSIQFDVTLPPGSSLEASNRACAIVDRKLHALQKRPDNPDGIFLHFARRTGRAEFDEHPQQVNESEYIVTVDSRSGIEREEMKKRIKKELQEELPGVEVEPEQPLDHLISHMISGSRARIAVKIQGDDLSQLYRLGNQVKEALAGVQGVNAVLEAQQLAEEIHIKLRPDDVSAYGLRAEHVAHFLETSLQGSTVTQVLQGRRRYDLVVRLDESYRDEPSRLMELKLDLHDGQRISLGELADVVEDLGPNLINRDNARRRMIVRCSVTDRGLSGAAEEIEKRIRERVKLPPGYSIEYGGQLESQQRATRVIAILSLVSLCAIFVTLLVLYPSMRIVLQVLNAVPAAFIGGVLALTITNQYLTVASLVGFVSLGGIAVRNGILLMSHYLHLMREEGESFSEKMIERGSLERLAPVLMTALTAGIALVPLVVGGKKPGLEILYPVATVILGGLMTSTLCEFLLHPGLFWKFSGKDGERLARAGELAGDNDL